MVITGPPQSGLPGLGGVQRLKWAKPLEVFQIDPQDASGRMLWKEAMGMSYHPRLTPLLIGLFSFVLLTGCQVHQTQTAARLIQHQAMIDVSGLKDSTVLEQVKVHVAAPQKWDEPRVKDNAMFVDALWRSPSKMTGLGVAYVHLPIPLPAKALIWFAKQEYTRRTADQGELLNEWTDDLGRPWFEAQNAKYHMRGFCVTKGFEAWIVYTGYKREEPPSAAELGIAQRALETIVPTPIAQDLPQTGMATGNADGSQQVQ